MKRPENIQWYEWWVVCAMAHGYVVQRWGSTGTPIKWVPDIRRGEAGLTDLGAAQTLADSLNMCDNGTLLGTTTAEKLRRERHSLDDMVIV